MMKQILITTFFLFTSLMSLAQTEGVGINPTGTDPDPSAMLDVQSQNKGFLMPRLTTDQRDAISDPAAGLYIYNLDDSCFNYYTGKNWVKDCGRELDSDSFGASASSTTNNSSVSFLTDGPGNSVYLIGYFTDDVSWGDQSLADPGRHVYVARFDPTSGTCSWIKTIADDNTEVLDAVSDQEGNVYVVGYNGTYGGTFMVGDSSFSNTGFEESFILKIDADGNFPWAKHWGGLSITTAASLDPNNDLVIAGTYLGSISIESQTLNSSGPDDIFLAKVDKSGSLIWAENGFVTDTDPNTLTYVWGMDIDAQGHIHAAGLVDGSATFGTTTISSPSPGNTKGVIVRFDGNGHGLDALELSAGTLAEAREIVLDDNGNRYVSGKYSGSMTLGSTALPSGGDYRFVTKVAPNGTFLWALSSVAPGSFPIASEDIFLDLDESGQLYTLERYRNSLNFGGQSFSSPGSFNNVVLSRIDANGSLIWSQESSGAGNVSIGDLIYSPAGNVYVGGSAGGATGSKQLGETDIPISAGIFSGFVWPLNTEDGGTVFNNQLGGSQDNDRDASNELQSLSLAGNTLSISDGNSVNLNTLNQTLGLLGSTLSISNGNSVTLPAEVDGDVSNELQSLSLLGNTLSISNGNSISLPAEVDGDASNELQTLSLSNNTLSISDGNSVNLSTVTSNTDSQTLHLEGTELSISNGNTVNLSNNVLSEGGLILDSCVLTTGLTINNYGGGGFTYRPDGWQGFQATHDGYLRQFDAGLFVPINGYLRVYEGEGISGPLLYQDTLSANQSPFFFPELTIALTKDSLYTVQLIDTVSLLGWTFPGGNPYPPSISSIGQDYNFRVYQDTCSSLEVLTVNNGGTVSFQPVQQLTFADGTVQTTAPVNQTLGLNNNVLSISNGNSVNLLDNDPLNELQDWSTLPNIPADFSDNIDNVDDADADDTNELQTLILDQDSLRLSNGNGVALDSLRDNLGDHVAKTNIRLDGNWLSGDGNNEGIMIDSSGHVGLGTSSPQSQFHIDGGQVLMQGDFVDNYSGAIPDSGAGTRLMWIPQKSAFRVGRVDADQWDSDSIGTYSTVAGGYNNISSGTYSSVGGGTFNSATDTYSYVGGGSFNTASGRAAFVGAGLENSAIGTFSFVAGGRNNSAKGNYSSVVGGRDNASLGYESFVGGGRLNKASGTNSFVGGLGNTAPSYGEAVLGLFAETYTPFDSADFHPSDRLFVVGNGSVSGIGPAVRSNALTLLKNGNMGLGTSTPQAQLHTDGGQVLMQGDFVPSYSGAIPDSGAGTRLMWVPQKAAFRVGEVNDDQWDLTKIGDHSTVAGGVNNIARGISSFVGGGLADSAMGDYSFVGGGEGNLSSGLKAAIGGGKDNEASSPFSFVGGGKDNSSTGVFASVGGGFDNRSSADYSEVGGGRSNRASGYASSVTGGIDNTASGFSSFIGGGMGNTAPSFGEVVLGLYPETYTPASSSSFQAKDRLFVVGNGSGVVRSNALTLLKNGNMGLGTSTPQSRLHIDGGQVLMQGDFVLNYSGAIPHSGAGTRLMWVPEKAAFRIGSVSNNQWDLAHMGDYSTVAGGHNNMASGDYSFVGGGEKDSATGNYSFIGGGRLNVASNALSAVVAGASNRASGNGSFIGAGKGNIASGFYAVVVGGQENLASADHSFIGGGSSNEALGSYSSVGGGIGNIASNSRSFIGGGISNTASGTQSFVGGGTNNTASGYASFVGNGYLNTASGLYSFVGAGTENTAPSYGESVLGLYAETYTPSSSTSFQASDRLFVVGKGSSSSDRSNALTLLKNGNMGIGTSTPQSKVDISGGLAVGSGYAGTTAAPNNGAIIQGALGIGTPSPSYWLDMGNSSGKKLAVYSNGASTFYGLGTGYLGGSPGLELYAGSGGGNTAPKMVVAANGRVGIGTNFPQNKLDVKGGIAIGQNYAGNPTVSGPANGAIIEGTVGIGTNNPQKAKLEIIGSLLDSIPGQIGFLDNITPEGLGLNPPAFPYSLYADQWIAASGFHAHSDSRIKDIQGISNSQADLSTLMQIEVTDYRLRDSITKGNHPIKKVIAQQVVEVYPQAVSTNLTEVVPDIYQRAEVQDGWIMLATDLQVGERIKLITEHSSEIYEVLEAEPTRFKVSEQIPTNSQRSTVFVYGREVDDFHTVDYEALSMLNVSATQEQQRIIDRLREENDQQKAEIEMLKAQQSQSDAAFEARLQVLEALLQTEVVKE